MSTAPVAPALSAEPEYAKVEQKVDQPTVEPTKIEEVYYVDEIAQHILAHNYQTPCLQFPDDLVRDSAHVASLLQKKIGIPAYVLADTSYSSCCVDEIAAQHVKGDIVFHFGNACLNPVKSLPVVYVSRKELMVDRPAVENALKGRKNVVLYPDTKYTDLAMQIYHGQSSDCNLVVASPSSATATFIPAAPQWDSQTSSEHAEIPNRILSSAIGNLSDFEFVYLTDSPSDSLLLHWSTIFSDIKVLNGRGESASINSALRKRYRFVQNVKAAGTIGILINTLSLRDLGSLLERTKRAITKAEKKYYMFVVGKPNVAKLGNFEAIDVWVILGCPQGGIILNNEEYFRSIVTPYELELAFNDEWTGRWLLNFDQVFKQDDDETSESKAPESNAEEEPLFDLVTGKFIFGNTPLRQVAHVDLNDRELQTTTNALTVRNTVSTAAEKLQQRTWQGLGSDHDQITGDYAQLKQGRSGIARNYHEKDGSQN